MPHSLTYLPLGDLHASALNVRKHGPKGIDSLAASIRSTRAIWFAPGRAGLRS